MEKQNHKTKASRYRQPNSKLRIRGQFLSEQELMFVLYYHTGDDGYEALVKAGYASGNEASGRVMASKLLRDPRIVKAMARKEEAGLRQIEREQGKIIQIAAKRGWTLDRIFMQLDEIAKGPAHTKRGHADNLAAIKMACDIMGIIRPAKESPGQKPGEVDRRGDMTVLVYRPQWRDNRGLDAPTIDAELPDRS